MRPTDPAGFRAAWHVVARRWDCTVERARCLDPALLHESVGGELSFVETLRHLVFAIDAWVRRPFLGDPSPWLPLDLPWTRCHLDTPGVPRDCYARLLLDGARAAPRRMATVRQLIDDLTEESRTAHTEPVEVPGWPGAAQLPGA